MSTELAPHDLNAATMEKALIGGDLSKLTVPERLAYYNSVCESCGLNPLTGPFQYLTLNGRMVLYAKRDATDQLRKIHKVSIKIVGREKIGNVYVVTAQATDSQGRIDESTGAVTLGNLQGDALANALMKAETKAKRRVTLSICGLGMLDESEIESVPGAMPVHSEHVKTPETRDATQEQEQRQKAEVEAAKWIKLFSESDSRTNYTAILETPRLQTIKARLAECGYDDLIERIDNAARECEDRVYQPVPV